jgi:hypothetical protein
MLAWAGEAGKPVWTSFDPESGELFSVMLRVEGEGK